MSSGNALEQRRHVFDRIDRDADAAHFAGRQVVIGVVADLGGEVERHAQAVHALRQQIAIPRIRLGGGAEARILPHRPQPPAIHRRLNAAREGKLAGEAQILLGIKGGQVLWGRVIGHRWIVRDSPLRGSWDSRLRRSWESLASLAPGTHFVRGECVSQRGRSPSPTSEKRRVPGAKPTPTRPRESWPRPLGVRPSCRKNTTYSVLSLTGPQRLRRMARNFPTDSSRLTLIFAPDCVTAARWSAWATADGPSRLAHHGQAARLSYRREPSYG